MPGAPGESSGAPACGVYLTEPYGRGLIPETFEGYRRQRYRWTYGPVQEFQRHWRLFLPGRLATPSALTGGQKLHHANHGLDVMCIGLRASCFPLAAATAASMIAHHERVPMPAELWVAATCLLAGNLLLRWLTYRRIVRATARQALGGILAFAALTHVITTASLRALFRRPAWWQRTDKFRPRRRGIQALNHASSETVLGAAGVLAAAALAAYARGGIATALAIGLAVQALTYLTAPLVALAADRSLARATGNLLDIPAVAIAAGVCQPGPPVPARPHRTGTHARTPQPAGRTPAHPPAHHTHVPPRRPPAQALSETSPLTGTTAGTSAGQTQAAIADSTLADYRMHEPSQNRYDSYGNWYRSA